MHSIALLALGCQPDWIVLYAPRGGLSYAFRTTVPGGYAPKENGDHWKFGSYRFIYTHFIFTSRALPFFFSDVRGSGISSFGSDSSDKMRGGTALT